MEKKLFALLSCAFLQTTRKNTTNPILIKIFKTLIAANFLGRPSNLSFAKGITDKVSSATIIITHLINSGLSGISRKPAMDWVKNNSITEKKAVVINKEEEQVL